MFTHPKTAFMVVTGKRNLNTMSRSVAILYGWGEGKGHGYSLRRELRKAGFKIARRSRDADIIIAHSGGMFLIPEKISAQLIMLVGIPFYPGQHPRKGIMKKVGKDLRSKGNKKQLSRIAALNVVHSLHKPRHHYQMWRNWKKGYLPKVDEAKVLILRNQDDPLSHHQKITEFAKASNWNTISLPGVHDDLWLNPKRYVDILIKIKN